MSKQKFFLALAIALGTNSLASGAPKVTPLNLAEGVEGWVKNNADFIEKLCSTPSGRDHEYTHQIYRVAVSADSVRVADIRANASASAPASLVSCADKSVERVPPLEDAPVQPGESSDARSAEMQPTEYLQWLRDNETYLQELCASASEPGPQHVEAFAQWGIAVSFDNERVIKAMQKGVRVINCPRSGQTVEEANRRAVAPPSSEPSPPSESVGRAEVER